MQRNYIDITQFDLTDINQLNLLEDEQNRKKDEYEKKLQVLKRQEPKDELGKSHLATEKLKIALEIGQINNHILFINILKTRININNMLITNINDMSVINTMLLTNLINSSNMYNQLLANNLNIQVEESIQNNLQIIEHQQFLNHVVPGLFAQQPAAQPQPNQQFLNHFGLGLFGQQPAAQQPQQDPSYQEGSENPQPEFKHFPPPGF